MRSFAQKQQPTPKTPTGSSFNQHEAFTGQFPSILQLQRTIGNQAVQRLLQAKRLSNEGGGANEGASGFKGQPGVVDPLVASSQKDSGNNLQRNETAPAHQQRPFLSDIRRAPVSGLVQREGGATHTELMLAEQRSDYHRLVNTWHTRYMLNLETNARNARNANQRLIEFEEGSIGQLRTAGAVGQGIAYLFGTPGAVAALCVIVLTEVAAQGLSSRSAKIASAAARMDGRLANARTEVTRRRELIDNRIDATETLDWGVWLRIAGEIDRAGVPQVVPENIVYRDLLFAFARGGGYNISGSQWNVENMSPFGRSPWYHSWDWGSPGWTNGQDIAAELNALAQGDPSTRTRVSINPP